MTLSTGRLQANSFLFQKVQPGAKLWTDGASIYKRAEDYWPVQHTADIHKKFEFTHTSEIEGTFGNLRTFIRRMYHHTSSEKFPDYVREFCARIFNAGVIRITEVILRENINSCTNRVG